MIGVAGELATGLGVTPWAKGEALKAAGWAFSRWLETRGGVGSHEERQAIEQVRLMIVQHGEARFECADGSDIRRSRPPWMAQGRRRSARVVGATGDLEGRVLRWTGPHFRGAVARGARDASAAGDKKNLTCVVALHGGRKTRCYVLTAAVL